MKVKSVMATDVASCQPGDSLYTAARLMWDRDCGVVPVVDSESGRLEGVVTDRDLCMAAMLSNRGPMPVSEVMAHDVHTCHIDDDLRDVHATMRDNKIRRVPVIDDEQHLVGIVSLRELAVEAFENRSAAASRRQRDVAKTLSAVSQHYPGNGEED